MTTLIIAVALAFSGQSGPPPSPEAAAAELNAGNYAAAERDYRLIVAAYPQMGEAYTNLGISYFLQKKYQEAAVTLQKGLKLKPEMASAWLFLGISRFDLHEPDKALPPLQHYTAMNPGDAEGHYYLGLSFMSLDRYGEAAEALLDARKIDPKNTDILYHLAESYLHLTDIKGADQDKLRTAIQQTVGEIAAVEPDSIRLHQLQAGYFEATGESEKAIRELEEAVKTRPHVEGVYYTLGCYYLKAFRYDEALEQFNAELALDSPFPRTYLQMGHTYTDQHQPQKALSLLEKAIQTEPDSGVPWVEMGRAYLMLGQFDKAVSALEKGIKLGDQKASTYFILSNAYRKMGKLDLANQAAKRSEEASREQSNQALQHVREVVAKQDTDAKQDTK